MSELITEIDRVAETTRFNDFPLLDGSLAMPGRNVRNAAIRERRLAEVEKNLEGYNNVTFTALNGKKAGQQVSREDIDNTGGIRIVYIEQPAVSTTQVGINPTSTDARFDTLKSQLRNEIVPAAVEALISAFPNTFGDLAGSSE